VKAAHATARQAKDQATLWARTTSTRTYACGDLQVVETKAVRLALPRVTVAIRQGVLIPAPATRAHAQVQAQAQARHKMMVVDVVLIRLGGVGAAVCTTRCARAPGQRRRAWQQLPAGHTKQLVPSIRGQAPGRHWAGTEQAPGWGVRPDDVDALEELDRLGECWVAGRTRGQGRLPPSRRDVDMRGVGT